MGRSMSGIGQAFQENHRRQWALMYRTQLCIVSGVGRPIGASMLAAGLMPVR